MVPEGGKKEQPLLVRETAGSSRHQVIRSFMQYSIRIIIVILFLPLISFSQSPASGFKKLSRPEKWWVVLHPFVAKKAYNISREARSISKEMEQDTLLDHDADGGQVDAFRHSYWMARLTQEICRRKAVALGNAHERGNYLDFKKRRSREELFSDSVAGAMDLFNNKIGIDEGSKNKTLAKEELQKLIRTKILDGEMKIILKDDNGNSIDCDMNIINLKKYSEVWNVPRCLVNSGKQ